MRQSIGLIEVAGLLPAITVADTMAKVAHIQIKAIESAKGSGWMTVKIEGNVDSVKAATDAGEQTAMGMNSFISKKVIARPDESIFQTFLPKQEVKATTDKEDEIDTENHAEEVERDDKEETEQDGEQEEDHVDEKGYIVEQVEDYAEETEHNVEGTVEEEHDDEQKENHAEETEHDGELEKNHVEEKEHEDEHEENHVNSENSEVTCNLCNDPLCPRKKGEPRTNCIHYRK